MPENPGGDTLLIVEMQPTGGVDPMLQPIKLPVVVHEIYGCVFEPIERGPVEEQSNTITSHERAWAFMPVSDITTAITNAQYIRPKRPYASAQRDYKVFGLPEVEYDLNGEPDHVWITCEWRAG